MVVLDTCCCTVWDATDTQVRQCPEHHRYWRGPKELVSVTKVLKNTWPIKPDFSQARPEVLENARDRGVVVDDLFSRYVNGALDRIPAGTRQDAVQLFFKLRRWWDGRKHEEPKAQVMLADDDLAGTCDVLDGDSMYDVKATYNIEKIYPIQLGGYAQLHFASFQRPIKKLGIIHVTERYPEPKIIAVDMAEALQDWMILRQMHELVMKRTNGKAKLEELS